MNDSKSIRLHYLFRAAVLLAFAYYIWHLTNENALSYYVAPALARWIKLCPIPLGLMALSLIIQAVLGKSAMLCNCDHRSCRIASCKRRFIRVVPVPAPPRIRPSRPGFGERRRRKKGHVLFLQRRRA